MKTLDEPILEDDYPIHAGYLYVVDGKVTESDISCPVWQFKKYMKATEIRRCDIFGRSQR